MSIIWETFRQQWMVMGAFMLFMTIMRLVDAQAGGRVIERLSLEPRALQSPISFISYAFVHIDRRHLFGNLLFFVPFAWLVLFQGVPVFLLATLIITLLTALGVWLFGTKGSRQLGSSGLNLGYFGYLLSVGFFDRDVSMIILALFIFLAFFGLFRQVIPFQRGVSTSGHFFGFLSGIAAAWLLAWYYAG